MFVKPRRRFVVLLSRSDQWSFKRIEVMALCRDGSMECTDGTETRYFRHAEIVEANSDSL